MTLHFPTFERRVLVQQGTVRHAGIAKPLDNYLTVRGQGAGGHWRLDRPPATAWGLAFETVPYLHGVHAMTCPYCKRPVRGANKTKKYGVWIHKRCTNARVHAKYVLARRF